MSNHGGTPYGSNDPTSYGLQPPQPPPGAPGPYGAPADPYAQQQAQRQAHQQAQQETAPYGQQPPAHQPPAQQPPAQPPAAPTSPPPPQPHAIPTQAAAQQPAQQDPGAGRLIAGRYRLLSKLGHGGMGTVWRAKDETVDREVAVKEPRIPDHLPERERANAFERMRREARAAAKLDHPAVVNVHDVAVEDGQPWIVMEFVQGRSLGDVLQEGTLSGAEAARIGLEVLGALAAAHAAGVLHRDVKPDNVMLGRHDRVVLTDFGIAQIEGETNLTDTGSFVGSPEFIAPERVLGQRPGPASDLWSLGVVLYAATEGVSPFRRNNTPATLQSVINATPAAPNAAKGPLADAINRLLIKDPNQRPDAVQIRRLLEEAVRPPAPTRTQAVGTARGPVDGVRVSRKVLFGGVAVVLASVVAAGLVIADPFAGPTSGTEEWKAKEFKGVGGSVDLPAHYMQTDAPDPDMDEGEYFAEYSDPSGVINVQLRLYKKSDDTSEEISGSAAAEAFDDAEELQDGNTSSTSDILPDNGMESVKVTTKNNVTYQEQKAAENTVRYEVDPDEVRIPREAKIFYYRTKAGDMYKLTVRYPGKGDMTERGREVAQAAIDSLQIDKL
ncbi:serine/threonine-protein kinase [Streptomyces cavernicola]|uniref:non-specific serine/threonine protein kinase n=1 Tax=Streptomyces cavernicola TaxID=3043613 RepID=A0ABT6SBD7_9ACTN|nr:serine/threonine-protein kinase [Streptomyces sp. B-S-A6]MDI3405516.1 serine/threonine-protein kinase [Streptomyces sp. B-S-A6]